MSKKYQGVRRFLTKRSVSINDIPEKIILNETVIYFNSKSEFGFYGFDCEKGLFIVKLEENTCSVKERITGKTMVFITSFDCFSDII